MKIVQTLYTKSDKLEDLQGGWMDVRYHLTSWALSSCLLNEIYPQLELITDDVGKQVLIDELKLPYTSVRKDVGKDDLINEYPEVWALKKINSFAIHDEPFLHVDSDVFLFKPFHKRFLQNGLVAQNKQFSYLVFLDAIKYFKENFSYVPPFLTFEHSFYGTCSACNMGIVGGQNYQLFKEYYASLGTFLRSNHDNLGKVPARELNLGIEEFYFYQFAQFKKEKISFLFNKEQYIHPNYPGFADFHLVPDQRIYLHLIMAYKKVFGICEQMSMQLKRRFPEVYERLQQFLQANRLENADSKKPKYYRTKAVLRQDQKAPTTESTLEHSVSKLIGQKPEAKQAVLELFQYEQVIEELYEQAKKQEDLDTLIEDQANYYQSIFEENDPMENWEVSLNPLVKEVAVNWEWVDRNPENTFLLKNAALEFEKLLETDPREMHILLFYHPENDIIGEYILRGERVFFEWLAEGKSLRLSDMYNRILVHAKNATIPLFEEYLIGKLRYLITHNVILLSKENVVRINFTQLDPCTVTI